MHTLQTLKLTAEGDGVLSLEILTAGGVLSSSSLPPPVGVAPSPPLVTADTVLGLLSCSTYHNENLKHHMYMYMYMYNCLYCTYCRRI